MEPRLECISSEKSSAESHQWLQSMNSMATYGYSHWTFDSYSQRIHLSRIMSCIWYEINLINGSDYPASTWTHCNLNKLSVSSLSKTTMNLPGSPSIRHHVHSQDVVVEPGFFFLLIETPGFSSKNLAWQLGWNYPILHQLKNLKNTARRGGYYIPIQNTFGEVTGPRLL